MAMVLVAEPVTRRREIEPLLHGALEDDFGQIGQARIDGMVLRPVGPLRIRNPGRQPGPLLVAGRLVVEGCAAIDGEGRLDVLKEQFALIVAENDAGIRRDLLPLVGERLDAGLTRVVAPLAFVIGDPRGNVFPRAPFDQLVESETLPLNQCSFTRSNLTRSPH